MNTVSSIRSPMRSNCAQQSQVDCKAYYGDPT
jgi:hypothetical protein